jgi:hypothetical protein
VSADIPDFRAMAENESMAIRFFEAGNATDMADQLVAVLQSPRLQHDMAGQNFAAGLEMTMPNVVSNYLRWFELARVKRSLSQGQKPLPRKLFWPPSLRARAATSEQGVPTQ